MDDKGLDLSLGLPCGGSSDARTDDTDERTSKILNDFRNFLNASDPFGDKRKNTFGDVNSVKKQETDSHGSDNNAKDEGSTADNEEVAESEAEGSTDSPNEKERANTFASDYPAIKPGIAADVKFGGSGSFPNLPWVSTTGSGPNGKTISGVTYKFNATQIKIVCACHGTHLTTDEFIRHASEEDPTSPRIASLPNTCPAASAKS